MPVTEPGLPLYAAEIERTLPAAGAGHAAARRGVHGPDVLEWERANFFRRGWICAGHVEQVSRARAVSYASTPAARACSSSATTTASRARS